MVYELVQASGQPKSFPSNFTDILQLNSGFYTGSIADTVKNRPFNLTGMCSIEIINGWSERKTVRMDYFFQKRSFIGIRNAYSDPASTDNYILWQEVTDNGHYYFREEIADKALKAKKKMTDKDFCFVNITDSHYQRVPVNRVNEKLHGNNHLENVNRITNLVNLDCRIHLGDIVDGTENGTGTLRSLSEALEVFFASEVPSLFTLGNHDINGIYANANGLNPNDLLDIEKRYPVFMQPLLKYGIVKPDGKKDYYFKDFTDKKVRVIMLNNFDNPLVVNNGKASVDISSRSGFGKEQVAFLIETLKTVPNDYYVIIGMHQSLAKTIYPTAADEQMNGSVVKSILEAFQSSSSGSATTTYLDNRFPADYYQTTVEYDFKSKPLNRLICVLNGHHHNDRNAKVNGINYVQTLCSLAESGEPVSDIKPLRTLWSKTEDAFDIVNVNFDTRKVYFTRFGAGNDREISF